MKGLKKLLTGILAATMIISSSITAFAGESTETSETPETGNTISIENAYKGETYNIYRMLDLDLAKDAVQNDKGYSYLVNDKWTNFWNGENVKGVYVDLHKSGDKTYVVWKTTQTAKDMTAFGKLASAYAKTTTPDYDKIEVPAKTADDEADTEKITFKGLANGYYMITSTLGTAVTIGSTPTNKDQDIKEKNSTTTTEKEVLEGTTYGKSNDAQIGDTVTFKSAVNISKNQVSVKYHDVMTDGLTWDGVSATHVYTDAGLEKEVTTGFTVKAGARNAEDPDAFVVEFTDKFVADLTYTDGIAHVYIQYTATLNDNALIGRNVETNTPIVTYGNGGKSKGTPTETTTHKFEILKYDGADAQKNPLAGAKFQVFEKDSKTPLTLAKKTVGEKEEVTVYRVVDTSDDGATLPDGYVLVGGNNELVTVASDKITVEGVDSKKYEILETEAPLGFNKIDGRIEVVVDATNEVTIPVANLSGSVLPSTGGIGTTIFYILGGILIVAGVAYFIVRRKASAE